MNSTLQTKIYDAAPRLYRGRGEQYPTPFQLDGITCGDGWYELLLDLSTRLERSYEGVPEDRVPYVTQCKSKFGELRLYLSHSRPEDDALIREAEGRSLKTCESCGAPGYRRVRHIWYHVACDAKGG